MAGQLDFLGKRWEIEHADFTAPARGSVVGGVRREVASADCSLVRVDGACLFELGEGVDVLAVFFFFSLAIQGCSFSFLLFYTIRSERN